MDVSVSDLLTCPRCGPTYGLVLMPLEASERRVRSGLLGCASCRERYPIEGGVADLRVAAPDGEALWGGVVGEAGDGGSGAGGAAASWPGSTAGEEAPAVRLAGLMGLAGARGAVLVAGPAVSEAVALSSLVEGVEVVALPGGAPGVGDVLEVSDGLEGGEEGGDGGAERAGVSRVRATAVLPFRSGSLRGVALTGSRALQLAEGARVLGREGHLVLEPAPAGARVGVERAGLRVVLEEGGVVVAVRGD